MTHRSAAPATKHAGVSKAALTGHWNQRIEAHPARKYSYVRDRRLVQRGVAHCVKLYGHAIRQASVAEAAAACAHYAGVRLHRRVIQDERKAVGSLCRACCVAASANLFAVGAAQLRCE